jgi:predicted nucleic acid-binding protein
VPVIDASLYIALINANDPDHPISWAWFRALRRTGQRLLAPVTLLAEVSATISEGVGDPQLALRAVRQIEEASLIDLIPVTLTLATRAAVIAAECGIRSCAAIYVALAESRHENLVTLDMQLLERAVAVVETQRP